MADYTRIAEIGSGILALLKEALVPELLGSVDQVGLCSPEDHGDFAVGIWLYDIREDTDIQMHEMVNLGQKSQRYPSAYVTLRYMITLYLQSDLIMPCWKGRPRGLCRSLPAWACGFKCRNCP